MDVDSREFFANGIAHEFGSIRIFAADAEIEQREELLRHPHGEHFRFVFFYRAAIHSTGKIILSNTECNNFFSFFLGGLGVDSGCAESACRKHAAPAGEGAGIFAGKNIPGHVPHATANQ